jgi:hypothetical protein
MSEVARATDRWWWLPSSLVFAKNSSS